MKVTDLVSISVVKGGATDDIHSVDGISGGTITSDGVTDMLAERFKQYLPFFNKKMSEKKELSSKSLVVDDGSFNYNLLYNNERK